jgi:lysophospholipase L1-like esterase
MSEVPDHAARRPRRKLSLWQRLLFSAIALVAVLGGTEISLRLAGVEGAADRTTTWFADHILRPPLWFERPMEDGKTRYMAAGQQHHFRPFDATKPQDAFRIAVFGGSAAHGYGVLEPAAFPHRLQQLLQRAVPDREVQVINLGTIAWSSQQILWAGRQVLAASDWDLILVYSGHNELLELSSWKSFKPPSEHRRYTRMLLLNQRLEGLRIHQVLRSLLGQTEPPPIPDRNESRAASTQEAQELGLVPGLDPVAATPAMGLDQLESIPRDQRARIGELERDYAARTYRHNIGKLVALAQAQGIPSFLINPAPNDFHDPAWFPRRGQEGERFNALMEQAEGLELHDLAGREKLSREALQLFKDPRAMHLLAQSLVSQGRANEAFPWLKEARRWAEYPNRVVPEVSAAILAFEGEPGVLGVLDAEALFRGPNGTDPIDYRFVYDHCHPSVEGNWLLAGAIAERLISEPSLPLPAAPGADLAAWTSDGQEQVTLQTERDPRLWEWTGLIFHPQQVEYIADAQGQWRERAQRADAAASQPTASANDWLWAGNHRFYDYRVGAALAAWDRALELDSELCVAPANAAYALRSIGRRKAALESAEAAVLCDPQAIDFRAERDLLIRLKN